MPELAYSQNQQRAALSERSDQDLLQALASGEELALDELVRRKTRPLVQAVWRIVGDVEEARDIVQVTFVRLWENRDRYDSRYSPNTWIYRIATNLAIDQLRSRQSRDRAAGPVRWHIVHRAENRWRHDAARLEERDVARIFAELAGELSEKQRLAFILKEIEGLSGDEVAAILGCRSSTVRNHVFNARQVLQREVRRRYPEYVPSNVDEEVEP